MQKPFKPVQHFTLTSLTVAAMTAAALLGLHLWTDVTTTDVGLRLQVVVLATGLLALCATQFAVVRRAQAAIERQAADLEAQRRVAPPDRHGPLGELVAGVARHLNTPLTMSKSHVLLAIRALEDMLPRFGEARQPAAEQPTGGAGGHSPVRPVTNEIRAVQEMLNDVLLGIDQAHGLVDNLCNAGQPGRDAQHLVSLNSALSSVMYIAQALIPPEIKVVQKFGHVPPLACNVAQLDQVFLNLIVNAAQSIEGPGTITVATSSSRELACVAISHTGQGVGMEALSHIFDPCFTGGAGAESAGLGLTVARDIVADHGGEIVIDPYPGEGAQFRIYLRLKPSKASRLDRRGARGPHATRPPRSARSAA